MSKSNKLNSDNEKSDKTCFVICPIDEESSDIRKHSDRVLKFIIRPVVENLGYETPVRADQIPTPGTISRQIIEQLIDSDLVIADLSFGNPNVFYELAVRHVTKKPCIHMIKFGDKNPFDTSPSRAIQFNLELEGVENAKNDLKKQIQSIIDGKSKVDNPIGNALTMKNLESSGDSSQIMIADILEELRNLSAEVRSQRTFRREVSLETIPEIDRDWIHPILWGTISENKLKGSKADSIKNFNELSKLIELEKKLRNLKAHSPRKSKNETENEIKNLEATIFELKQNLAKRGVVVPF